jgi:hypothetical protein
VLNGATTVIAFKDLLKSKTDSPYALYALSQNLEATRKLSAELEQLPSVHGTINLESLVASDQDEKLYTIEDLALILGPQTVTVPVRLIISGLLPGSGLKRIVHKASQFWTLVSL